MKRSGKRVTIYDIAKELGIAPSSVSKALNNQPSVSARIKRLVQSKAQELDYKHNTHAANLRKGSSRTIGVIVPKINTSFFSSAISGMEEACFENGHHLIICQSEESYIKEVQAIETLIQHNVDCIIISLSMETKSTDHLEEIINQHINLIQFDRVDPKIKTHTIVNDNKKASYKAVKHLIDQGYTRIAMLGGPDYLTIYKERKDGYIKAIKEAGLNIPYNYIVDNVSTTEVSMQVAAQLLRSPVPPDAFFASDYSALGILKVANLMGIQVPGEIGIMGFANEPFTELISPSLSSVDQKSRKLGKNAANIYFNYICKQNAAQPVKKQVIESSLIIRESSLKNGVVH
ncbi:MAG TPA: LacI family DNA-binding transcriptional regulator [Candidatus Babeliaceae bacterium]|nr:LacI family DNA-binding transcriptional regulator [Candidatus Babeliaceae bacterium]